MAQTVVPTNQPTSIQINLVDGLMFPHTVHESRHVSHLSEQFSNRTAVEQLIAHGDPLVYEIFHHAFVTDNTDMAMGMSVISSGKVGDEYYMTKGHVHERGDQAEIYYCVQGTGLLLMDDLRDDFHAAPFSSGTAVHIPPQYAHRVVNTGTQSLIFVSAFHLAAGHVYQPVAELGFANIVVEVDSKPVLRPSPMRTKANQSR
jgi:glucose-6-phosphate isomerase